MIDDSVAWQWVIGHWRGEQAKSVIAHANHGLSYFALEQGEGRGASITAAFRRPTLTPVPHHLTVADYVTARALDKRFNERHSYGAL